MSKEIRLRNFNRRSQEDRMLEGKIQQIVADRLGLELDQMGVPSEDDSRTGVPLQDELYNERLRVLRTEYERLLLIQDKRAGGLRLSRRFRRSSGK